MGCVYRATNLINGKYYIGKTMGTLNERRLSHLREQPNTYFHRALRKYGVDSFEWDVLFESDNDICLCKKEKLYIKLFSTFVPNGYNMTTGGDGKFSRTHPQSWHDKMRIKKWLTKSCYCVELNRIYTSYKEVTEDLHIQPATIGVFCHAPFRKAKKYHFCNATEVEMRILRDAYMNDKLEYGVFLPDGWREKMIAINKKKGIPFKALEAAKRAYRENGHYMTGKHHTQETIEKIIFTKKQKGISYEGKRNPSARAVINLDDGKIFDTMKEASIFYSGSSKGAAHISSVCRGTRNIACKHRWAYYNKDHKGDTE